jgi:hypothetical protein
LMLTTLHNMECEIVDLSKKSQQEAVLIS